MYKLFIFFLLFHSQLSFLSAQEMEDDTVLERTSIEINTFLYQMLKDFDQICAQHNIHYWLTAGTLLGAVRHQGLIPWDDDIDVELYPSEEKLVESKEFSESLKAFGYKLAPIYFGYRVMPIEEPSFGKTSTNRITKGIDYTWPFIDIFTTEFVGDGWLRHKSPLARKSWPQLSWEVKDLFPIKRETFGPSPISFAVNLPQNPIPYLERGYEKEWSDIAYQMWDHKNSIPIEKKKVKLITRTPGLANTKDFR